MITAQNASVLFGGESFLPVHYFRVLRARGADVHLVTHARNRDGLTRYFDGDTGNMIFAEDTAVHKAIFRYGRPSTKSLRGFLVSNVMAIYTEISLRRTVRPAGGRGRPCRRARPMPLAALDQHHPERRGADRSGP